MNFPILQHSITEEWMRTGPDASTVKSLVFEVCVLCSDIFGISYKTISGWQRGGVVYQLVQSLWKVVQSYTAAF